MSEEDGNKIAICLTTIFDVAPFVDAFQSNITQYGHEKRTTIYIAGDNKQPDGCIEACESARAQGLNVHFITIDQQREYLRRFPTLDGVFPENSDNRRNLAFLRALEEGADTVISVDDDNFPISEVDFVGQHNLVGSEATLPEAVGHDGWYNLCDLLTPKYERLYPRGFPYNRKHDATGTINEATSGRIGVNVGLWKRDPDCDAIARLHAAPQIEDRDGRDVILGRGVRCPINTQNTALSRDAMWAYYYVRMGVNLKGMKLDRYGDILSGYFLQVCADAVGDRIRIGGPIADHRRNVHNLFVDLYNELAGIMVLEDLAEFLSSARLPSDSYRSAYLSLADQLVEFTSKRTGFIWDDDCRSYFELIAGNMRAWVAALDTLT